MQIWDQKKITEILNSLEQEIAKAQNEISCAKTEINKASKRLSFSLSAVKHLKDRDIQEK